MSNNTRGSDPILGGPGRECGGASQRHGADGGGQ